jgi:cell division septal protein FtsQ
MSDKRAERLTRSAHAGARAGRWAALGVGLVIGIGVVTFAAFRLAEDPRLCARVTKVSGVHRTSIADVIAAASLPPCRNVWFVNRRAVATRVEALAWVQSADVELVWPAGLQIRLTERKPAAVVVFDGAARDPQQQAAVIDATRRVLALGPPNALGQTSLPTLHVPPLASRPLIGRTLEDPAVTQALGALTRLRALGLDVTGVSIDPATGIGVTANRNLRVLIGEPTDFARKAVLFLAIAERIARPQRVAYIDLRSVAAPTILYRNGEVRE